MGSFINAMVEWLEVVVRSRLEVGGLEVEQEEMMQ